MVEIKVGDIRQNAQAVVLGDKFSMTIEKGSNFLKKLADVGSAKSFSFSLPVCETNDRIFLYNYDLHREDYPDYLDDGWGKCWIYENGREIFEGFIILQELNRNEYKCNVVEYTWGWNLFKSRKDPLKELAYDDSVDWFYYLQPPTILYNAGIGFDNLAPARNWLQYDSDGQPVWGGESEGVFSVDEILSVRLPNSQLISVNFQNTDVNFAALLKKLYISSQNYKVRDFDVLLGNILFIAGYRTSTIFGNTYYIADTYISFNPAYSSTTFNAANYQIIDYELSSLGNVFQPFENEPFYNTWGVIGLNFKGKIKVWTSSNTLFYKSAANGWVLVPLAADGTGEVEYYYHDGWNLLFATENQGDYVSVVQVIVEENNLQATQKLYFYETLPNISIIDFLQELAMRFVAWGVVDGDKLTLWRLQDLWAKITAGDVYDFTEQFYLPNLQTIKRYRTDFARENYYYPAGDEGNYIDELPNQYYFTLGTNFWQNFTQSKDRYKSPFGTCHLSRWSRFELDSNNNLVANSNAPVIWWWDGDKNNLTWNSYSWDAYTPAAASPNETGSIPAEYYYHPTVAAPLRYMMLHYYEVKLTVQMSAESFYTFDVTKPIYFQQFNSYFLCDKIRRNVGSETAELTLIKIFPNKTY